MRLLYHRPLALAACLGVLCALLVPSLSEEEHLLLNLLLALAFAAVLILFLANRRLWRPGMALFLCLLSLLMVSSSAFGFYHRRYGRLTQYHGTPCTVEGSVHERLESGAFFSHFRVHVESVNGKEEDFDAFLECTYASALQVGDRFKMTATSRAFTEEEAFSEENFRLSQGMMMAMTCSTYTDCQILDGEDRSLEVLASKLNFRLAHRLYSSIGDKDGGIASALLLGNRTWLSENVDLHFRRTGISHLLALSGLHVSVLVGFFEWILRRCQIHKAIRAVVIPLLAIAYLVITGFSPSIFRAVVMATMMYLAYLNGAEYDSFTALCLSMMMILIGTPYAVSDVSMWLSFLAAGAIVTFTPAIHDFFEHIYDLRRYPRRLVYAIQLLSTAVFVGIVANASLLFYSAAVFGETSVWSVPLTLILSPVFTALLILSLFSVLLPFLPFLPQICGFLEKLVCNVARTFSEKEVSLLPMRDGTTQILILLLTLTVVWLAVCRLRKKRWLGLIAVMLAVTLVYPLCFVDRKEPPSCTVISAGHGVVRLYTEDRVAILVNDTYGIASSAYEIKEAAQKENCTEIRDLIFCKNYNQATYFISKVSERIYIRNLHLQSPETPYEEAMAARLAEEAEHHGIRVYYDAAELLSELEPE